MATTDAADGGTSIDASVPQAEAAAPPSPPPNAPPPAPTCMTPPAGVVGCAREYASSWANAVASDSAGEIFAGGAVDGLTTVDFGGGPLAPPYPDTTTDTGGPPLDALVVKLDGRCDYVFAKRFGGKRGARWVDALAVDPDGNVYIAGFFMGAMEIGSEAWSLPYDGGSVYVAKLSSCGDPIWAKQLPSAFFVLDVAATSDGVFVLTQESATESYTLQKLDGNGAAVFTRAIDAQQAYGPVGTELRRGSLTVEDGGGVLATASAFGSASIGDAALAFGGATDGGTIIADLGPTGDVRAATSLHDVYETTLALAPNGDRVLFGRVAAAVDLGTGTLATDGGWPTSFVAGFAAGADAASWVRPIGASQTGDLGIIAGATNAKGEVGVSMHCSSSSGDVDYGGPIACPNDTEIFFTIGTDGGVATAATKPFGPLTSTPDGQWILASYGGLTPALRIEKLLP